MDEWAESIPSRAKWYGWKNLMASIASGARPFVIASQRPRSGPLRYFPVAGSAASMSLVKIGN